MSVRRPITLTLRSDDGSVERIEMSLTRGEVERIHAAINEIEWERADAAEWAASEDGEE